MKPIVKILNKKQIDDLFISELYINNYFICYISKKNSNYIIGNKLSIDNNSESIKIIDKLNLLNKKFGNIVPTILLK